MTFPLAFLQVRALSLFCQLGHLLLDAKIAICICHLLLKDFLLPSLFVDSPLVSRIGQFILQSFTFLFELF